jgi:bile acid:Na+ symporter, BASS family
VITVPFTAQLVLSTSDAAHVPTGQVLTTLLIFQLIPLLAGMLLAYRFPAASAVLARISGLFALVLLVVVLVMLAPTMWASANTLFGSRGILAMLIVVVLSIVAGWILGGTDGQYKRTLGIATALRNIGLCALVATADFPNTLVPAAVMTYLLVQAIVSSVVGAYFKRSSRPAQAAPA